MIVYFDTSAVLPPSIEEPGSQTASRLWDEAGRVVSSRLIYAEARAALAVARRVRRLDEQDLRSAVDAAETLHSQLHLVEVTEELVQSAGVLAEQFDLGGYDAVHLASLREVADPGVVLAAGDQSLLAAAEAIGIASANLHPSS